MITNFPFSENEINSIVKHIEDDLLKKTRIPFLLVSNWNSNFPNEPGVYAIFDKGEFIYVGETADLRERMKDIRRTYNHTFRKKIGTVQLKATLIGYSFSSEVEVELDNYMVENLEFSFHTVNFGRKEVEFNIFKNHQNKLINSVSIRGSKNKK